MIKVFKRKGQTAMDSGYRNLNPFLGDINTFLSWSKVEGYVLDNSATRDTKFYLDDTHYLEIIGEKLKSTTGAITVKFTCNDATTELLTCQDIGMANVVSGQFYFSHALGKTSRGNCLRITSQTGSYDDSFNFNIYLGDVTTSDGKTSKGCIYLDTNSYKIITDSGVSTESYLGTTITPDRKAVFIPVVSSMYGDKFNDVFQMRYGPLSGGAIQIEEKGEFLSGAKFALKDGGEG